MRETIHRFRSKRILSISRADQVRHNSCLLVVVVLILSAITTWSFWPVILDLINAWRENEDYSAGQLVPLIVLFLVWRQRKTLAHCTLVPCWWGGIVLLLLAQASRVFGLLTFRSSPERYALVLTIAGALLMIAGWQVFRRLLWVFLFLFLMVPLPGRVHNLIAAPLQRLATMGSVFVLEAFVTVSRQGNTMILNGDTPLGVAEACSGLRMLTAFIIVAAFIAYMVKRPRWQKAVLLASSIPVAIVCNILRIVATAVLMLMVNTEVANKFFHDFAGLVLMPAAVVLLFGELWLMDRLTVSETLPQRIQKCKPQTPSRACRGSTQRPQRNLGH